MHQVTKEEGFADRSRNYAQKMFWVVAKDGKEATIEMNGATNFGRKHLLLPSRKADKTASFKKPEDFDAYVAQKNANRAQHRGKAQAYAAPATDLQREKSRWKDKYHSGGSKNTVVNLVTSSQKSIDSKKAAEAFFDAIVGGNIAKGAEAVVTVDFGQMCVLSHNKQGVDQGTSTSIQVLVKCVGDDSYEVVHMETH
jgi:hypothetical protein